MANGNFLPAPNVKEIVLTNILEQYLPVKIYAKPLHLNDNIQYTELLQTMRKNMC